MNQEARVECREVGDLIPWYLNGTLDASRSQRVREHLAGCGACRQEAAEARAALAVFSAHLPSSDLVDLAWGRAPAQAGQELAERHLAQCAACRADLDLLRDSRQLEQAPEPTRARPVRLALGPASALAATALVAFGAGALWQSERWRQRLELLESGQRRSEERASGLAAALERQRQAVAELEGRAAGNAAPQANLPVLEVFGGSQVQRSPGARINELRLPRDARWVALLLSPEGPRRGAASVELRASDGRLVWEGQGLRPGPLGAYTLGLPAELLGEGSFTLVLRWPQGLPESFALRVSAAP